MICENCGINEATVRYKENINGVKKELNLCENCSRELGIGNIDFSMPINFSSFFASMLEDFQNPEYLPMIEQYKDLTCKDCGYTFEDILSNGKLGCANCYDTFESKLDPIIKKIQGSNQHMGRLGKITEPKLAYKADKSKDTKNATQELTEVQKLKEELKKAVKEEKYEEAAILRDKINKLEK